MIGTRAWSVLAVVAAVMAGAVAPAAIAVGTGGTGLKAYSRGAIAAVSGRVSVNGIQWQAGNAAITINGRPGRAQDDLRDGMVADVDGDLEDGTQKGTASNIAVNRVALGVVARVGTGGTGLKAAGLVLAPAANVVVAGASSVADLADGDWVDVYGYTDGESGEVHATRIERVAPANATELHGTIVALDAGAMVVNGVNVDASAAVLTGFGSGPQVGDRVAVLGVASGDALVAAEVQFDASAGPAEAPAAEVEDAIEAVLDVGRFVLSDIEVDARAATFTGGSLADIAAGRVVHVRGALVDGVLLASEVGFDDDADGEVEGVIQSTATDGTFTVGGVTVDPAGATISGGTASDLAPGRRVDVHGARRGGLLHAARIDIEDAPSSQPSTSGGNDGAEGAPGAPASPASGDDAHRDGTDRGDARVPATASGSGDDRGSPATRDAGVAAPTAPVELAGAVLAVDGSGRFRIRDVTVDASQARVSGGTLAQLRVGTRVEVVGTLNAGLLVASRVAIDD